MNPAPRSLSRLTELDWTRIAAFGLLILYHAGMFYVPWDWHVKSPRPVAGLVEAMLLLNPWRLSLLFVVSGAATALLIERSGASIAGARTKRLLLPLLFGMAVIVPPQSYLEVVEKFGYAGSFGDFLIRYFAFDSSFCRTGHCLVLPTWNHLWFVAYLWVYTMLLIVALRLGGNRWVEAAAWRRLCTGSRLLWMPWLLFAALRLSLYPRFPSTHDLVRDWYDHALLGAMFVLGFVLFGHRDDRFGAWEAAVRLRWWALATAVIAHLVVRGWTLYAGDAVPTPEAAVLALRAISALRQWAPIIAILGFARLHLAGRDGPLRRMLTEAVFPFYIVHQTVIVVAAHSLSKRDWPQGVEAAAVIGLTLLACIASYVLARRIGWLRPLFGLDSTRRLGGAS